MRADIAQVRAAQRQKFSVRVERELRLDIEVAPLIVAQEGFLSLAGPFHRPAEAAGGPDDQGEFGIKRVSGAEIAADIVGDDAHRVFVDAQDRREFALLADDIAAAGEQRVFAVARIVVADRGARFQRRSRHALNPGFEADHMACGGEGCLAGATIAKLGVERDVRIRLVPDLRRLDLRGRLRVRDGCEWLEVGLHQFGGVLRRCRRFGDDDRNRLANKAYAIDR